MKYLKRTWAIFAIAVRRLLAQRGLALATVLGLIVAVSIVMSIPLYTDAVYYTILQRELSASDDEAMSRPPFAFMFRYVGSVQGLLEMEDIEQVDQYLMEQAPRLLGLPHELTVRYLRTDNFRLFPTSQAAYADVRDPLEWVTFAYASDFENQIDMVEGRFPQPATGDPDTPVEVIIPDAMAERLGIQVGESFMTFRTTKGGTERTVQIPVTVTGTWRAKDPESDYWFYRQSVFDKQMMIPEATFMTRLVPVLDDEIAQGLWYLIMDGSSISTDDVGYLVARINNVVQRVNSLLPDTRLEYSPLEALQNYRRSSRVLNVLLYAFSIPIIGLLLAFIGVVVGLAVERQRNEIAVLRSRGATMLQVLGIALLQAVFLGAIALGVGIFASQGIAYVIGSTRSFLDFTAQSDIRVLLTRTSLRFGVFAVIVVIVAQVIPSIGAARHTIISYKAERARTLRPPWWQRAWLDVLLLIPAGYGAYLLRQQGSIAVGQAGISGGPFDNPLLFLVPALVTLALTLFLLRILPKFMAGLAWLAGRLNGIGFLLASRYLSRDPSFYTAPLVLLILTLSLSIFTASLAVTLDRHLHDQSYYRIGADARLAELGVFSEGDGAASGPFGAAFGEGGATEEDTSTIPESRWVFIPVSEHLRIDGIEGAARVGDYDARMQVGDGWLDAYFIGIDRIDFPKASYWRRDFAPASLGALMNSLALNPNGILLPRQFMADNSIRVGDSVQVQVSTFSYGADMSMTVVGEIDYFPTWYEEEDGPLIVGNLDYLFEEFGGQVPYDVWVRTAPGIDYNQMVRDLGTLDLRVVDWRATRPVIVAEQEQPSRQGLFGVLSVGFLAAALLTVLGFLLYALFSFRRRFIELGTLRAIGLSPGQMTAFLAWELLFLIMLGVVVGTLLGVLVSQLFIPYLQVGNTPADLVPPFLVEIAWPAIFRIYALFGALFAVALTALAFLLLRMKIFQAIKLGETV
ncbi:MAG: FtsX-like permease family protein [Caldilineaceae bacterium]